MKRHLAQILCLGLVLIAFYACRKDDISPQDCPDSWVDHSTFDTIVPNDYLAFWPGSWWEYNNGLIDSAVIWVKYPKRHSITNGACTTIFTDTVIVPKIRIQVPGNSWTTYSYILGNELYEESYHKRKYEYWNDVDSTWSVISYSAYTGTSNEGPYYITRSRLEHLDSLVVGGATFFDVEKIESFTHFNSLTDWFESYERLYYAKDFGLVRYEHGDPYYSDTVELVNYHIAPH